VTELALFLALSSMMTREEGWFGAPENKCK